jgi:photosystem II stability/assembly factor-like uncharacterized protein
MPQSTARDKEVVLLVGTMKGAFFFRSDSSRKKWSIDGPHFPGESVYALYHDSRGGRNRTFAAPTNPFFGGTLRTSDDFGKSWTEPDQHRVRFPEDSGLALKQIWQITGSPSEQDVLYAGVEPACLFKSSDGGDTWEPVEGMLKHEHRPRWQPGAGGLCLHTIIPDPAGTDRMMIAISAAGAYRTDDGGRTWRARNNGVRAEFLPDKHPEFGQCVHKIVHHPARPERLFLQNHWGLYRSDDWGESWQDIANGVPSDFGFAMAMHPRNDDTVYIVPMQSDMFRVTPEAKMRIYRTSNGGQSWDALTSGLPQENAYETVLRDCLATDTLDSAGVYVGTRSGKLFASSDDGDSWTELAGNLPPIVCVKTAVLEA